jgi:hypothetical protein
MTAADIWMTKLDGLAGQANANLRVMFNSANDGDGPDKIIAGALVAIASQLAYGHAIAAAEFYMAHLAGREES